MGILGTFYVLMHYLLLESGQAQQMPRKARIDALGAVKQIIIRGIERLQIFRSDSDRADLLQRLGRKLSETQTDCFV